MDYTIHTDGSCWPNPGGPIGYGFTIKTETAQWEHASSIDATPANTNNVAEFAALYEALAYAVSTVGLQHGDSVNCYSDSQIMVNLMKGLYQPNSEKSYYRTYKLCDGITDNLLSKGVRIFFHWIPREQNQECDDLSKAFQPVKVKTVSEAVLRRAHKKMRKDIAIKKIKAPKESVDIWEEMSV